MPYGDEKHEEILGALIEILGEQYVEDDPGLLEAFSRCFYTPVSMPRTKAEFWVLPETAEDVQKIYRLANKLDFPLSASSTGSLIVACGAVNGYPYWCYIDPKRMTNFHIDAENMVAVVEPYVSIAQVQAEAMKLGLYCGVTGIGGQGSALATNLTTNSHYVGWRTSKGRSLLAVEGVLPNGELYKTGSLAYDENNYSWDEGAGVTATGVIRGAYGPMGTLGMVTKIGMKLYPWPGPKVLETRGKYQHKEVVLPKEAFRSFMVHFPDIEHTINAVREMGEAELGGIVYCPGDWYLVSLMSNSRKEWWENWTSDFWQNAANNRSTLIVSLWAYTSEKQLDYEEKVMREIVSEIGGEVLSEETAQPILNKAIPNMIRNSHETRCLRVGPQGTPGSASDSLGDALRSLKRGMDIKTKARPHSGDGGLWDMGDSGHFWAADFGRIATTVVMTFADKSPEFEKEMVETYIMDSAKDAVEKKIFMTGFAFDSNNVGPVFANVHLHMANLKKELDPNNIANPTRVVNLDALKE